MIISRLRVLPMLALLGIAAAQAEGGASPAPSDTNWTSYNENVNGQRFVDLNQITPANAGQLGEVCRLKIDETGAFHTSILELDGVLYFTTATDTLAVDATNCKQRWRHHYVTEDASGTPLKVNRGVAYANGVLYRGTLDSRLLAIDMVSGKTLWQYQIGDPQQGEFFSAAPQIYAGLVIVGAAGGDWGTRGRIMAFDAKSGREVWRFYTVPRGDEAGADSWKDQQSAQTGGGGSWSTYALDMAAGEVFVPVGNPTPDLLPHLRPGENLYTDSMIVLDAATGKLKWYHQLLSNDGQDLDLGASPMLYYNSKGERMVTFGGKDGYLYAVNRENQQRVFKTPVTTVRNAGVRANATGVEICPGPLGGVEWNGPAFDRPNKALVVGSVDWCAIETAEEGFKFKPGLFNLGGTFKFSDVARGWITSLDADIGAVRWKFETPGPMVSGLVPTSGGVLFAGDMKGNFFVLSSTDGKELYRTQTGGAMAGGVISYMQRGRQYVAAVAGNVSRLTFGVTGSPTLLIYALGGNGRGGAAPLAVAPTTSSLSTASGAEIYGKICANCHGGQGEGAIGPALKGLTQRMDLAKTIQWIENPSAKMPKLYPSPLDEQAVKSVAAYVQGL